MGDTPKEFAILQNERKIQQVFRKNVKVSLPKSYHSADTSKGEALAFNPIQAGGGGGAHYIYIYIYIYTYVFFPAVPKRSLVDG